MMTQEVEKRSRRAVRKARTRDAILNAAQNVVMRRGYHGASVEEIAGLADVAVGSIYTYFRSKEGLLRALVQEALREDEAAMDRAHVEARDPIAKLTSVRQELSALHRRNPIVSALALAPTFGGIPGELTDAVVARTRAELDRLEDALSEGMAEGLIRQADARLVAAFLWAAWSGMTTMHLRQDALGIPDSHFDDLAEVGFRILATGLMHRRPPGRRPARSAHRGEKRR